MKYTVLLKCEYCGGSYNWLKMTKNADSENDAVLSAKSIIEREDDCTVVDTKVFPYSEGDENDSSILRKISQQDEKENAPTNLVRTLKRTNYTLDDIATELRGLRASRPEGKHVISALSIISTTLSLLTVILLLLSLMLR